MNVETGKLILSHDNGSQIVLKNNGDVEIKATGKISFSGLEYNFE